MHPVYCRAIVNDARQLLAAVVGVTALLFAADVSGYDYVVYGDGVQLACWHLQRSQLACNYRGFAPPRAEQISARLAGRELPAPQLTRYAAEPGTTAIMFLVDADPPVALASAKEHLQELLKAAPAHHDYALASFANPVNTHAPLAPGTGHIHNGLDQLNPGGESAQLYRSALEAVRMLGHYPAQRRALFLLSDGLAPDSTFFHDHVVDAARQYGVAIFGIGLIASPALPTALERLRRLAEDTGGLYMRADSGGALTPDFASRAFAQIISGGRLQVDLSRALAGSVSLPAEAVLELHWQGAQNSASAHVPLRIAGPGDPSIGASGSRLISKPAFAAAVQSAPPVPPVHRQGWISRNLLWLGTGVGTLLAGAIIGWFLRGTGSNSHRALANTLELNARSFAYLEVQGELHTRHPVSGETFRIGRHADNELVVADASISRVHAEIKHEIKGHYVIRDLDSLNGVYVNGRKARKAMLNTGDLIELGDVTLKFTVFAAHDFPAVDTSANSTVTPFRHPDKNKGLRPN